MGETIRIQDLIKTFKKRFTLIGTITILALVIAAVMSFFVMTPIYQASTQILVNQTRDEQTPYNAQDIQTNLQLINTYNVIIKSPAILTKVIEELDLEHTSSTLNQNITVNSEQNSQVVNISVQDPDPYMAEDIANTTAQVFQEEIKSLMKVDNVNILAEAQVGQNPVPVKPNPIWNMLIAGLLGLMVGIAIAFLKEYLDTTIKSEEDIEENISIPILGVVSSIPDKELKVTLGVVKRRERGGLENEKKKEIAPIGGTKTHHLV